MEGRVDVGLADGTAELVESDVSVVIEVDLAEELVDLVRVRRPEAVDLVVHHQHELDELRLVQRVRLELVHLVEAVAVLLKLVLREELGERLQPVLRCAPPFSDDGRNEVQPCGTNLVHLEVTVPERLGEHRLRHELKVELAVVLVV